MLRALALLLLVACSSDDVAAPAAPLEPPPETAADLEYTTTSEVRFGDELVGFVVDVLPVPVGVEDRRAYTPGTVLVEDKDLALMGFISPYGASYVFDEDGGSRFVSFGTRNASLARFYGRAGMPQLAPITP